MGHVAAPSHAAAPLVVDRRWCIHHSPGSRSIYPPFDQSPIMTPSCPRWICYISVAAQKLSLPLFTLTWDRPQCRAQAGPTGAVVSHWFQPAALPESHRNRRIKSYQIHHFRKFLDFLLESPLQSSQRVGRGRRSRPPGLQRANFSYLKMSDDGKILEVKEKPLGCGTLGHLKIAEFASSGSLWNVSDETFWTYSFKATRPSFWTLSRAP